MIEIVNEQEEILISEEVNSIIKTAIEASLQNEGFDMDFEISVLITNNEGIKEINYEFRKLKKETDVLSFPILHFDYTEGYEFSKSRILDSSLDYLNPETNEVLLGDIVISIEKAYSQAEEYGHSINREIAFLTVHSVLHLLGYDHEKDVDRAIMRNREEAILEKMRIFR